MDNFFSIGELSRYQNISKQTLIYYDRIGLFRPAYVDPDNGYRYYSAGQIDYLDTILIMKKMGFSLREIREHMQHYTIDSSLAVLRRQLTVLERQIGELRLIQSRLLHRCTQMENAKAWKPAWSRRKPKRAASCATRSKRRTACGKSASRPSSALPRPFRKTCPSFSRAA